MAQTRVRVFVDFWNFQLSWNEFHRAHGKAEPVKIPWEDTLPRIVVSKVSQDAVYVGTHVYASVDPNNPKDKGLSRFLHAMDGFPGYNVTKKDRRPGSPPKCNHEACRKVIVECPSCKKPITRTVEKGIDTALLTDMVKSAFDNTFDAAVLITEDSDFVPAVQFIQERWTKQIYHAYFRGKSDQLRNMCWKHVFFDDFMAELVPLPKAK